MITPFFSLDQDDEFVYIDIRVSHIRFNVSGVEMVVDGETFIFSLSPYYLRLEFPFACVDDERSYARYESKSDNVKVRLPKELKGQYFPNLDLTAKILSRTTRELEELTAQAKEKKVLIEDLDVGSSAETNDESKSKVVEDINWKSLKEGPTCPDNGISPIQYGFNDNYNSIIGVSIANGNDINELSDPEKAGPNERIIERLIKENIKFDPEYYAADYLMEKYPSADDDKDFSNLLDWKPSTSKLFLKWYKNQQKTLLEERENVPFVEFSKEEQERMLKLPRKAYLLESSQIPSLLACLVSLLFSYHFELRETSGEHNVESAWTIGKLTPQIAFLDSALVIPQDGVDTDTLKACIVTGIRRALSYPYHRNFKLCMKVWDDVYYNIRGGRRLILKSLLDLRELFRYHDLYYVYDKIWLEDMCSWLLSDSVTEGLLRKLAYDLKKETSAIQKADITFEKANIAVDHFDADDIIALNLLELESMAEDLYSLQNV